VIAGLEGRALQDNASKKLIAYHEVFGKGSWGEHPEVDFGGLCQKILMGIYIYSHPGVERISDIFKNDFKK
jgi:hypothetical protein